MRAPTSETEQVTAWLSTVRFCEGLDADALAVLSQEFQVRHFNAGETLASAGDEVTEFWILVEGELETFITDPRGREKLLGTIRRGETVGEISILENAPTRHLRFHARSPGTLIVAPAARLHVWVQTYPRIMQNLFFTLSERFRTVAGVGVRNLPSPRLGVVVGSPRGCVLLGRLAECLQAAGERLQTWASRPSGLLASGTWPVGLAIEELRADDVPLLRPPNSGVDRQIVIWSSRDEGGVGFHQLSGCDELLWLVEPRDVANLMRNLAELNSNQQELAQRVRIVWLLSADYPVAPLLNGLNLKKADIKVHVESTGVNGLSRLERQGLDRLVRSLRGLTLGIALAGGGAKGMAHFGVLHSLEEAGLSFDIMSGTSAGAMAGILYASGMSPKSAVINFQRELTPPRLLQSVPKWPNWYLVSQYRRNAWDRKLRKYLHDWRLEQLSIPFHAVTVDLVKVSPVVRCEGDAVRAILESINLPIVSRPILLDGMALVDGGVLNNLPADVLAENGVDFVVGVDVSSHVRDEFAGNRPGMPTMKMKNPGALDTLFRIFESLAHNMGKFRNRAVDFWIKPDTSGFGLADFHRTAEIAAAGETAANEVVAELKQRLMELEKRLLQSPRQSV